MLQFNLTRSMDSLRVGLGQNNLKLSRLCFDDHRTIMAKPNKVAVGGRRSFRRLSVVAEGSAHGLVIDSKLSAKSTSMFDHNVAVKKRMMDKEEDVSGNIDMWILNSIKEIVNKIEEAPFLVHIYPEDDQGSRENNKTKNVREKASTNSWSNIKHRWEIGSSIPNGIALVEELKINGDDLLPGPDKKLGTLSNDDKSTKVSGIVVQERGLSYPACYILKTDRVKSTLGICTHFCIFRAQCFGESVEEQIKKHWLV